MGVKIKIVCSIFTAANKIYQFPDDNWELLLSAMCSVYQLYDVRERASCGHEPQIQPSKSICLCYQFNKTKHHSCAAQCTCRPWVTQWFTIFTVSCLYFHLECFPMSFGNYSPLCVNEFALMMMAVATAVATTAAAVAILIDRSRSTIL